jgi:transcriptional regulator with XRE-family HTH domain
VTARFERLRGLRIALGFSGDDLARRARLEPARYRQLERGEIEASDFVTCDEFVAVSGGLGVAPDLLHAYVSGSVTLGTIKPACARSPRSLTSPRERLVCAIDAYAAAVAAEALERGAVTRWHGDVPDTGTTALELARAIDALERLPPASIPPRTKAVGA